VELRRRIYVEEQGLSETLVESEFDAEGLHLGLFCDDRLISVISAYVYTDRPDILERYGLPRHLRRVVRVGGRVHDQKHRRNGLAVPMAAHVLNSAHELFRPDAVFAYMARHHASLNIFYRRRFGLEMFNQLPDGDSVIGAIGAEQVKINYLLAREARQTLPPEVDARWPCLLSFLEAEGREDLVCRDDLAAENLYTEPLAMQEELPRLTAQAELLFTEQRRRLDVLDAPARPGRLLDAGCGPGVYLGQLARDPRFAGWELSGMDVSPEMIALARRVDPSRRWLTASVYDTREPSDRYDVVHSAMLLIHLRNVPLALRELHRILRPGGLLYVVNGNDSTFEGPEPIRELIRAHASIYEGDRMIMSRLPELAEDAGFELVSRARSRLANTSPDGKLHIMGDDVLLDRATLWAMFGFIGQRSEVAAKYAEADALYAATQPRIAIAVETQVYARRG